jgi:hypothetical protein
VGRAVALALGERDLALHLALVLARIDDGEVRALLAVADIEGSRVGRPVGVVAQEEVVALAAQQRAE